MKIQAKQAPKQTPKVDDYTDEEVDMLDRMFARLEAGYPEEDETEETPIQTTRYKK